MKASENKDPTRVKPMKDKDRVTVIICTSADRKKYPLAVIRRTKKHQCYDLVTNGKVPLPYMTNKIHDFIGEYICAW